MPACVRSVERFLPFETARSSLRSSATQGTTTSLLPRVPACTRFSRNDGLSEQANDNAGEQAPTKSRSDETRDHFTRVVLSSLRHPPHHEVRVGDFAQGSLRAVPWVTSSLRHDDGAGRHVG